MLLVESMYYLTKLAPNTRTPTLFQKKGNVYLRINAHPGNGLDTFSYSHTIYMLSNFITETGYFGSLVFRVSVVGHVVADGTLTRELRTPALDPNSTSVTAVL